jgi:hypothetical protein
VAHIKVPSAPFQSGGASTNHRGVLERLIDAHRTVSRDAAEQG